MPHIEVTIDELQASSDWAQVFADENAGNVSDTVEPAPPTSAISIAPVHRADVVSVIAAVNGDYDGPDWLGVFLLKDGRYLVASGGCDYTGWDCQAGNALRVCLTMADVLQFGLSDSEKDRLGL